MDRAIVIDDFGPRCDEAARPRGNARREEFIDGLFEFRVSDVL
jgi:hypothetical protein